MDKNYCVFGDSVTNASYIKNSWVNLLRSYLQEKYQDGYINLYNLGVDGHTTKEILERLDIEAKLRFPQQIIFAVGINDSAIYPDGKNVTDINLFTENLQSLINESRKEFTLNISFIGLVLGSDVTDIPRYEIKKARKYDDLINQITTENGLTYIKLFDYLKIDDFSDGLHPNEQGHQKMFNVIKNYF